MMGTRGLGKIRGLLLGSVAAKVIHDATCPVWTNAMLRSKPREPGDYRTVICAIDATDEAIPLLRFADALARELGAKVHVAHGVPEAETRLSKYFDFDLRAYLMDSAHVAISKLQREAGTEFPASIKASPIANAVSEAALEQNADLIVIGQGKVQQTFGRLRTHAYQIIRDAPCPVLRCVPVREALSIRRETQATSEKEKEEHSLS